MSWLEKIQRWIERASQPSNPPSKEAEWELSPAYAHPEARKLLTEPFFWDPADDGAPLGSDTGSDTLHAFREWRQDHPRTNPRVFFSELLASWGVEASASNNDEQALAEALPTNHFNILTRDDAAIALAFAQLVLEGTVDESVRDQALDALRRQNLDTVIQFRGWSDAAARRERIVQMSRVLKVGV